MQPLPIIIVAYNRPQSLARLLKSVDNADFPAKGVNLYISLDKASNSDCADLANNFDWKFGKKTVIEHEHSLGLFNHIMACGDLAAQLGGAIILEDDLFVSPAFYDFAQKATAFYQDEPLIGGISLYSYAYTETRNLPFEALKTGFDTYFMQVASSWGQVWTATHWQAFKTWFNENEFMAADGEIPDHLMEWGDQSWKKHFNRYLISSGKYFVHPQISFTTNFEDPGTHATTQGLYQVSLAQNTWQYSFESLSESKNRYDAWFEIEPECLKHWNPTLKNNDFTVDIYGTKNLSQTSKPEIITSRNVTEDSRTWSMQMFPLIMNVAANTKGADLRLAKLSNVKPSELAPREWFFRTRSLVPDYILEKKMFHVLVAASHFNPTELGKTIASIKKQDYSFVKIWLLVPSNQANKYTDLDSRVRVISCKGTSETELIKSGLKLLQHGNAVVLKQNDCLLNQILSSATEIFHAFSDINWLLSAKTDPRGFVPFGYRLNAVGFKNALKSESLDLDFTSTFFRVEWVRNKEIQEVIQNDTFTKWLADSASHALPTLVALPTSISKNLTQISSALNNNQYSFGSWFICRFCSFFGKHTNSTWPHKLFNLYFNIPDTIRYDTEHKTWYRDRF